MSQCHHRHSGFDHCLTLPSWRLLSLEGKKEAIWYFSNNHWLFQKDFNIISVNDFVNEFIKKHNVDKLFSESVDVTIPLTELENALELVDGYEWNLERFQEVSNNNIQENKIALMIYIFAMLGSLILKEPYGLWVIFTVAYFGFTQTMKDRYGGEIWSQKN